MEDTKIKKPAEPSSALRLLSVIVPARDEEDAILAMVEHLSVELRLAAVPHEIVVIDDGSTDTTWQMLLGMQAGIEELKPVRNKSPHGFGRAVVYGIEHSNGDAVVIMMADRSDDPGDVVQYWRLLNEGWDAVFGSRFIAGGGLVNYPFGKLIANRLMNWFIRLLFQHAFNDTTNAFKAYRRSAIDGCRPFLSPHFNLTVEIPLKIVIRGYSWTSMPITWKNRTTGTAKLKLKEMGSRYFFIILYCWLEKYFSRNDYHKSSS